MEKNAISVIIIIGILALGFLLGLNVNNNNRYDIVFGTIEGNYVNTVISGGIPVGTEKHLVCFKIDRKTGVVLKYEDMSSITADPKTNRVRTLDKEDFYPLKGTISR